MFGESAAPFYVTVVGNSGLRLRHAVQALDTVTWRSHTDFEVTRWPHGA